MIQLGKLMHDGLAEQRVYALLSGGAPSSPGAPPAVRLLPDTAAAQRLLAAPSKPVHFWHADPDNGETPGPLHPSLLGCMRAHRLVAMEPALYSPLPP